MTRQGDRRQSVLENLRDAGCEPHVIERFLELEQAGKTEEQVRLLGAHRNKLLKTVHEHQKNLDCLDFLLYTIRKEKERD